MDRPAPTDWLSEIGEHLRRVADFRGREGRLDYWAWVVAMAMLAGTLATLALFYLMFSEELTIRSFTRLRNQFLDARIWALIAFLVLIAAATTRRLHDVGRRAWPAVIPAGLSLGAMWAFGRLFKGQPDAFGEIVNEVIETGTALRDGELSSSPLDLVRDGLPSGPRVWDASASELALAGGLSVAAAVTALPILLGLIRKSDPEPNSYGPPPKATLT